MKETENYSNRYVLTIEEAARYFHLGEKKIKQMTEENPYADFYFMNGNRCLIKRKLFEQFIDAATVV